MTFDICWTTDIKIHQKCVESNLQRAAVVSCCCNTEPTDAFLYHCVCIYPFKHNTTLRVRTKYSIQHTLNSSCWQTMLDNRKMIFFKNSKFRKWWKIEKQKWTLTHTFPAGHPLWPERPQKSWRGWRQNRSHTVGQWHAHISSSPPPGRCIGH